MAKRHIFFVRHGSTDWNNALRFQGRSDIPLNDEGRAQARRLALRSGGWRDARLFCSALSRARETADILSASCGCEVVPRDGLLEMGFGDWEGHSMLELEKRDPEAFREWRRSPFERTPPGGESFAEIRSRLLPVLEEASACDEERVVIVSHGGVIRAALAILVGMSLDSTWRVKLSNCSVTAVESGSRGFSLVFLNDCLHLDVAEEILPKIAFTV